MNQREWEKRIYANLAATMDACSIEDIMPEMTVLQQAKLSDAEDARMARAFAVVTARLRKLAGQ
jgi:hypothetical protein